VSKSSLEKAVIGRLLREPIVNEAGKRLVASLEARALVQSSQFSQCLVLGIEEKRLLWSVITKHNENLPKEATVQSFYSFLSRTIKKESSGTEAPEGIKETNFERLLKSQGYVFGKNIFYYPGKSHESLRNILQNHCVTWLKQKEALKDADEEKFRQAYSTEINLDHGLTAGTASSLIGAGSEAARLVSIAAENEGALEAIKLELGQQLTALINSSNNKIISAYTNKQKQVLQLSLYKYFISWDQIINKDGTINASASVAVVPRAAEINQQDQAPFEKEVLKIYFNAVREASIKVLKNLEFLKIEGSPSLNRKIESFIISQIFDNIKPRKTLKKRRATKKVPVKTNTLVSSDLLGIKKSVKPLRVKNISVGRSGNVGARKPASRKTKGTPASSSPLQIIANLNSALPEVLQKNMQYPALRYRTGRFAGSAKVLSMDSTLQGFPVFSYTYQKAPYQTFEPGNRQGSIERDPRRLIDKSMREIATQYAIGRFYTKRV
jgi:hypothetical protein